MAPTPKPAERPGRRERLLRLALAAGRRLLTASALAAAMVLTSCGNTDPLAGQGSCEGETITVGSANFPESETVAELYVEALRINGFSVDSRFGIGSREAYIPALRNCAISVIPEYTGNLLQYLDSEATARTAPAVEGALTSTLSSDLALGTPAPAQNSDSMLVTRETAEKWQLRTIADLAAHSDEIRLGAPAEFQERPVGLPGLQDNYGLKIDPDNFVPVADGGGPATVNALVDGEIDVANIFSTSPAIEAEDLVVLDDPKHNFPAQNVVPLMNATKHTERLVSVLNAVSEQLTTPELIELNESVSGSAKTEPADAARTWLATHGLDTPIG